MKKIQSKKIQAERNEKFIVQIDELIEKLWRSFWDDDIFMDFICTIEEDTIYYGIQKLVRKYSISEQGLSKPGNYSLVAINHFIQRQNETRSSLFERRF